MNRSTSDTAIAAEALFALLASLLSLSVAEGATARPLSRFHDPVAIRVSQLPGVEGRRDRDFVLLRLRDGTAEAVRFQFDPRGADGELDVDALPGAALDGNDDLVFMAKDTGERADPSHFRGRGGVEIEVTDPLDGGAGWAYLLAARAGDPPAPTSPYVRFDAADRRATSDFYAVDYADGRNFLTGMRISTAAAGNGGNFLRQTRMKGEPTFSLFLADVRLSFTERDSIVRVEGIRNGPVRAIRRVHLSVDLGPFFPDLPSGTVYTLHYLSSFATPTRISVPWLALETLRDFRFENLVEFEPGFAPTEYWDGANPQGARLGGGVADLDLEKDHDWWVASGESGTFLQSLLLPSEWTQWGIGRGAVVHDGAGSPPSAGFTLRHMTRLRHHGTYSMQQATVVLPQAYRAGDETQVMAMFHHPLRVEVRALGAP